MKWLARLDALTQKSEMPRDGTDKTDTSPSVSSVSSGIGTFKNSDDDPLAALPPNILRYTAAWQRWFNLLVQHKYKIGNLPTQHVDGRIEQGHRTAQEAHALAYGEAINLWHSTYGQRPDTHRCAGCDKPIGRSNLIALPDGARVHDDADLHCLVSYDDRWRSAAADALTKLGIDEWTEIVIMDKS